MLTHRAYTGILVVMVVAGGATAFKRYLLGLWLGRRTYTRYAPELSKLMEKAVLIQHVAQLSRSMKGAQYSEGNIQVQQALFDANESEEQSMASKANEGAFMGAYLSGSTQVRINDLLGEFEEPDLFQDEAAEIAISDIIRFRQSVAFLNTTTPFSRAFGRADNREICIANSQRVYERFLHYEGGEQMHFNTIAKLCIDGDLDEEKLRKLIKLFRPDREGILTKLDFVKSIDTVYKEIRLLRAGIANSQRVDRSSESIFHFLYFFILGCVCLAILGIDPFALFVAVSGFIVGFAFMVRYSFGFSLWKK